MTPEQLARVRLPDPTGYDNPYPDYPLPPERFPWAGLGIAAVFALAALAIGAVMYVGLR